MTQSLVKISPDMLEQLRANQQFLVGEMLKRDIVVETFVDGLVTAKYNGHVEYLIEIEAAIMPRTAARLADDKYLAKQILHRAGLSVPRGAEFCWDQRFAALEYALDLGCPVALKPTHGTHGEASFLPLSDITEVNRAMELFYDLRGNTGFLIEEFFVGKEYRVFVTRNGDYAVLHREPAYVIGDGAHTIAELAEAESDRRLNPRKGCLCGIVLDESIDVYLAGSGRTLATVPAAGEKVTLRANSNLKTGGVCEDATDLAHFSVIELCRRALAAFPGMPYAGVDFMTTDITALQNEQSYRILEVNSIPVLAIHMNPWRGKARNVAAWVVDMIFPEMSAKTD